MSHQPVDILLDSVQWQEVQPPENNPDNLPYVTHRGVLRIWELELPCAVLSNGQRIFYGDLIDEMMGHAPKSERFES